MVHATRTASIATRSSCEYAPAGRRVGQFQASSKPPPTSCGKASAPEAAAPASPKSSDARRTSERYVLVSLHRGACNAQRTAAHRATAPPQTRRRGFSHGGRPEKPSSTPRHLRCALRRASEGAARRRTGAPRCSDRRAQSRRGSDTARGHICALVPCHRHASREHACCSTARSSTARSRTERQRSGLQFRSGPPKDRAGARRYRRRTGGQLRCEIWRGSGRRRQLAEHRAPLVFAPHPLVRVVCSGAEARCTHFLRRLRCRRTASLRLALLLTVSVRRGWQAAPRRVPQASVGATACSIHVAAQPVLRRFSSHLGATACLVAISWHLRAPSRRRPVCSGLPPRLQTRFQSGWRSGRVWGWPRHLQSPGSRAAASRLRSL